MTEITLRLAEGSLLVLPASLNAITTYVVLEQEAWFEKETGFLRAWLKPGMTANLSIIVDHRDNVLKVANSALRYRPPEPVTEFPENVPPLTVSVPLLSIAPARKAALLPVNVL